MLARAHKKFQRGQHSEIYSLALKEQDKTKMELPLVMVSEHAFWYLYLPTITIDPPADIKRTSLRCRCDALTTELYRGS